MSKLSLNKNKGKKKLEQTPNVLSGQRTLTSYFSTTKITSTEATKEDENEVVMTLDSNCKENETRVFPVSKPSDDKAALKEKPLTQNDADDLKSPTKKKQRVSSSGNGDAADLILEAEDAVCQKVAIFRELNPDLEAVACERVAALELSDFDCWSDFEIDESDPSAKKSDYESLDLSSIQRCVVGNVEVENDGSKKVELSLFGNKELKASCIIKDSWAWESNLSEGNIVNVRAIKAMDGGLWQVCHDPDEVSLLVEKPDVLLSCTTVMSALRCRRAAVLSELFKGLGMNDSGGYLALGKLMHEVTQKSLDEKLQGQDKVAELFESLLKTPSVMYDLYAMNNDLGKLREAAQPYFSSIARFLELYASGGNIPQELISESARQGSDAWPGKIDDIVDIEDTLWMPQFGLKGKLDLTSNVKKHSKGNRKLLVPLELKTGRVDTDQVSHRGQLMLYIAMLAEIEQTPVDFGLLIYLKNCAVKEVCVRKGEMRDAIIMRNELAKSISNTPEIVTIKEGSEKKILKPPVLPEPIKRPRECARCPYLEVCTAYSSKENYHNPVQSDRLKERKHNLTSNHIDYFIHWASLSQIEEQNNSNNMSFLWTKSPQERESDRLSLCDLKIVACLKEGARFKTILARSENSTFSSNLNVAGINPGDFVVFGNKRRIVLGLGTVESISSNAIELILEKDFSFNYGHQHYSIDLYKSNRMLTTKMVALANLLADCAEAFKLRQLIIDRMEPVFVKNSSMNYVHKVMPEVIDILNPEQRECVQKVLEAKDYVLVRGLPGSGKTATIVALVRILAAVGYSVLVSSHTNSAVDNVLCKLLPFDLNILRLGASSKVAPSLKELTESALLTTANSFEHLDQLMSQKTIIGVTCTSANHPLLKRKRFDYCIVDEATQVPQPSAISALLCAKVFVLVGDPDQLQPVVSNKDAQELGMQETLFDRLYKPESTAVLGLQYRMNSTICDLANKITYKGSLKCGTLQVAQSKFIMPNPKVLNSSPTWVQKILGEENGVVFVDTGCTKLKEAGVEGDEVTNEREAAILQKLILTIIEGGINKKDIGVMTPFRRQVAVITSKLCDPQLDISTVDQFQGKDKLVSLVSFVKSFTDNGSQENSNRGGILNDSKRMTVAITRARVKLILVGDLESLQCYEPLRKLKSAIGNSILKLSDEQTSFTWAQVMK